jgi:adenylate cyclase
MSQIRQGLATNQAIEVGVHRSYHLALLVEAYAEMGQTEAGLAVLAEALTVVDKSGERFYEAELYRLKGTLTLQSTVQGPKSKVEEEAEECFLKAIDIARTQQAKSLELRAAMSLVRLRQHQAQDHVPRIRLAEVHRMLSEIYGWFTEGFDTADLKAAKALLAGLAERG